MTVLFAFALCTVLLPVTTSAQCHSYVQTPVCMGMVGTGITCSVQLNPMLACPPPFSVLGMVGVMAVAVPTTNTNVQCLTHPTMPGVGLAIHTPAQMLPAACSFAFNFACGGAPMMMLPPVTCLVSNGNSSLPVELMKFEIEPEDSQEADSS